MGGNGSRSQIDLSRADASPHVDRFMAFVEPQDNGCWYRYSRARNSGYTTITANGKRIGAHRFAYAAFVGDIPAGMEIDHKCRDRGCVNPEHLELVTRKENLRRRDNANPNEFAAKDLTERIKSRVEIKEDCWIWTGALVRGYGVVSIDGRTKYVHRVLYELANGPIADGMDLDHHTCRNSACVNPAHLEPVTRSENVLRMLDAQPKDRCRRGHKYSESGRTKQGACIVCYEVTASRTANGKSSPRKYTPRRNNTDTHCANGHEYDQVGRFPSGGCRKCQAEKDAARGQRQDDTIHRYCPNGHDQSATGMRGRTCQACWDEGWCANGHDMNITGRTPQGTCEACREIRNRKYAENRTGTCAKGHDLSITGVNPTNGQCRECARQYARTKNGYRYTAEDLKHTCRNGHPRTPTNTKTITRIRAGKETTETICKDCSNQRNREYHTRKKQPRQP